MSLKNLASLEIFNLKKLQFQGHHFVYSLPRAKSKICKTEIHRKMSMVHFDETFKSNSAIQTLQVSNCTVNKELHIIYLPLNPIKPLVGSSLQLLQ